jgi:hypothetical protein
VEAFLYTRHGYHLFEANVPDIEDGRCFFISRVAFTRRNPEEICDKLPVLKAPTSAEGIITGKL